MIQLLHLHDPSADFQTRRAIEQLTGSLGAPFGSRFQEMASGGALGSVTRSAMRMRHDARNCDMIHAWGMRALATAAVGRVERIVFTPTEFPSRQHVKWIRAIMGYRDVQVVAPTSTLQQQFVSGGISSARCHLVRPGVDFARVKPRRDPLLRAALGLSEGHQVLLGVGESTRSADHYQAVWTGTILNVADRNTRLILWGRGPMVRALTDFASKLAQPELLILAEAKLGRRLEFEDLLQAADMILITATAPVPTLPIAIAMAAGLPIIATVTPTVAELLEDRHTALMTPPPPIPRVLAQRILQMRADPQLQWSLADRARTEAYEYFSLTRFLGQMREVYEQFAAGKPVEVPVNDIGPGLRFHGGRM